MAGEQADGELSITCRNRHCPKCQAVLDWRPQIQDPLTLSICLARLTEPSAHNLEKNRQVLLVLAREWNGRLGEDDREHTLVVLSQCVMKAVIERLHAGKGF